MAGKRDQARLRAVPSPVGDQVGADEVTHRVAVNLREQRLKRDLTLDQLAQITGVSRAALSQIETCSTNPTLGMLWRIVAGLGVPFAELVGEAQPAISVLRRADVRVLRSSERHFESRQLTPSAASRQVEVYELRLGPRARHVSESHGAGTRELVIVLEGALRMAAGHHFEDLQTGDSMLFNANTTHIYENPGATVARYHDVMIYPSP
jgi:transcriptional regulator with XRE-family HTH domain